MTYKDMTFCTAKNCGKLDCHRNTLRSDFHPGENDWISWIGHQNCQNYVKLDKKEQSK